MNHENENSLSGYSRACCLTIEEDGDTENFMLQSEQALRAEKKRKGF